MACSKLPKDIINELMINIESKFKIIIFIEFLNNRGPTFVIYSSKIPMKIMLNTITNMININQVGSANNIAEPRKQKKTKPVIRKLTPIAIKMFLLFLQPSISFVQLSNGNLASKIIEE